MKHDFTLCFCLQNCWIFPRNAITTCRTIPEENIESVRNSRSKNDKKKAFPKIKELFLLFFDFVLYTSKCRQKQIFHYRLFYMTPCLSQQTYLEFGRFLILCLYGFLFKSLSLQLWIKLFLIVFLPGFFFRIDAMSVAYNFRLEFKTKKTYLLIEKNQNGHD